MDISKYIKELLYRNNCVIIPGFGAFILNYSSASINPVSNLFSPPSKQIIFNSGIKHNDGLLASFISVKMNISYEEALLIIKDCVEDLNVSVNKGKEIKFEGIGYFKTSDEGIAVFIPDKNVNLDLGSYGLAAFNSPAINRETISRRIEKKIEEHKDVFKERRIPAFIKYAAAACIMISLVLWAFYTTDVMHNVKLDYSGIYSLIPRIYNSELTHAAVKKDSSLQVKPETTVKTDSIENKENTPTQPVSETYKSEESYKYFLIAGCFSIEENATKLVEDLKVKGYNAFIAGKTKTGLTRVAYSSYESQVEANIQLAKVRSSDNPSAWLLKN